MPKPLVSVVVPTLNRADRISTAIFSIVSQNVADNEIIVVDDGSTDGTAHLIESLSKKIPGLICIPNQRTRGPSGARNTGILQSSGKYLCFLDSDDSWGENFLIERLETMEQNQDVDVIFGNQKIKQQGRTCEHFDGKFNLLNLRKRRIGNHIFRIDESIFCALIRESFFLLPTLIIKSELMKQALLDENVTYSEDRDLGVRLEKELRATFAYSKTANFNREISADSLCSHDIHKSIRMYEDHIYLFRKYKENYKLNEKELACIELAAFERHQALSWAYRKQKQRRLSIVNSIAALKIRKNRKAWYNLLKSAMFP